MKRNLLFVMLGVLVIAAGMQPTLIKAEISTEVFQSGKIVAGFIAGATIYGIANLVAQKIINTKSFTKGFYSDPLFTASSYGSSSNTKLNENGKAIVRPFGLAALLVCTIPAARWGTCPKLGMQDLVKPLALGVGGLLVVEAISGCVGYQKAPSTFSGSNVRKYELAGKYAGYMATVGGIALGGAVTSYALWKRYK